MTSSPPSRAATKLQGADLKGGRKFATQERNALLLYNGRFNEKHDFIALEIVDEQVQLTFSAGETTTTVAPQVPGGVSDGRWHAVQVQYYNKPNIGRLGLPHGPSGEKVAMVTVDDCDPAVAVRFGGFVGNYSCAAQGTQSGSKKSLDLTGPLLLGGVPNLPEDFPVRNRQFVGCMRNLSIDGRHVDMASFIANNGTRAGCAAQRNFCDGTWCQNGGTCVSGWNTYLCECPLRFGGKNCEQVMPHPQRFSGDSVVSWSDLDITISVPWYLGLMFRTRKEDGVLMEATAGVSSRLHLQASRGLWALGAVSAVFPASAVAQTRPQVASSYSQCPGIILQALLLFVVVRHFIVELLASGLC
ncbi:cadherin EGF LAG seven-pass G-type receptor 1-like [Bubalus kerabau]|uniref:cadherin EGF LAG seven-pass G-type receptor 1-like n=1 Tax=Bubalus carabanensis TaxID=3119969 RepID=UPI00244EA754|nr:cadherin EGF LAG seven-pass G-type receptor 1-like [Bubalus carabanensis]